MGKRAVPPMEDCALRQRPRIQMEIQIGSFIHPYMFDVVPLKANEPLILGPYSWQGL